MNITTLIISLSMLAMNITLGYATLTTRKSIAQNIFAWTLAFILCLAANMGLMSHGLFDSYILRNLATLPFLFASLWLYSESMAQKIFIFFMNFSFASGISVLCRWSAARLLSPPVSDLVATVLFFLALLIYGFLYLKLWRVRVRQILFLFRSVNPLYAVFPVLSFVFFVTIHGPVSQAPSRASFISMILYFCLTALTYVILFSHFTTVYDQLQAENSVSLATRQLSLQKKYYEELDRGLGVQRKLLHDGRHHLVAVETMVNGGDRSSIIPYVEGLLRRFDPPKIASTCENPVINAVICGYVALAKEKGIAVSVDLYVPTDILIDEYELCSFFGNALENAIEACDRIEVGSPLRRFIDIRATVDSARFIVRVENSFQDDPERLGASSEKGSCIGLESMRTVVDRYSGSLSYTGKGGVFTLSAVFCLRVID